MQEDNLVNLIAFVMLALFALGLVSACNNVVTLSELKSTNTGDSSSNLSDRWISLQRSRLEKKYKLSVCKMVLPLVGIFAALYLQVFTESEWFPLLYRVLDILEIIVDRAAHEVYFPVIEH